MSFNILIVLENTGLSWSSREPWLFASLSYDGRVSHPSDFIVHYFILEKVIISICCILVVKCVVRFVAARLGIVSITFEQYLQLSLLKQYKQVVALNGKNKNKNKNNGTYV